MKTLKTALKEIAEHSVCCDARHVADKALAESTQAITDEQLNRLLQVYHNDDTVVALVAAYLELIK